ncbi:phage tail tape measure protein [Myxococcus sp. CA040A]|uniref:phage tail tape measure protein n=1 Tax=Myxococcus sp. CA040A TaxID=2741738 RepID=UPI00157A756D|nr:phage tail tape measure protein [Myxococcus sp. CA040A]NTX09028.1 phage tail tape measure protein [Myxococcus sp. CA040A]
MSEGTDLAELSIRIDTSGAESGVESLTDLTRAAEKTETATKKTETASEQFAKELARMVKQAEATSRSFEEMRAATRELEKMRSLAKDFEQMSAAAKHFQTIVGDTEKLEKFHARLTALDGAAGRLTAAFGDTGTIHRFMNELNKASGYLSKFQEETKAAESIRNIRKAAEDADKPVAQLSKGLSGLAGQAMGFVAVGAGLRSVASDALEFTTAMAQVSTLLDGDQLMMMGDLAESAKSLGGEFGRMPTEQAKALYEIMSAGAADTAKATEYLAVSNKLAIGGVTQVGVAADGLTSIMASYGTQLRSATEAADAMFLSAADGKTSIEAIARHIGKLAPIASQTGVSLQELLAANAALTKAGIKTETAMEGMRSILAQVAKPSNEARDLARELGVEFNTAGLKARGFAGFLSHLHEKTHGSTELLATLVGGVEALLPAMTLTGTGAADFAASLKHMESSAGKTEEAFLKMANTPQMKVDQLRARFAALRTEVGENLLDAVSPVMDGLLRNFDGVTTASRHLGEALAVLGAVRAVAWAQDWTKALLDKAAAAHKSREAVVNATLAEANFKRIVGESRAEALMAAQAQLERKLAVMQAAAAVEGPYASASRKAAIESNLLTQAKIKEALAIDGATLATRTGSAVMGALGGPIGIAITALGMATAAYYEFGRAAEEASEKARKAAADSAEGLSQGSQVVIDMLGKTKALSDQTKAMETAQRAREKLLALGSEWERRLTDDMDTPEELTAGFGAALIEQIQERKDELLRLQEQLTLKQHDVFRQAARLMGTRTRREYNAITDPAEREEYEQKELLGNPRNEYRREQLKEDLAEATEPFNKNILAKRQEIVKLTEAQDALTKAEEEWASSQVTVVPPVVAATAEAAKSANAILDGAKARDEAAKKATHWLERLEEEARALGKSKGEALNLTDEYKALTAAQRKQADVAIAKLREAEAAKELAKAEEKRVQVLQELNRELGDPASSKYAEAQKLLSAEVDAGRMGLAQYNVQLAKARTLWTSEGRAEAQLAKELEQLEKQLNPLAEAQKRMEAVQKLFDDQRISAAAYRKEVAKLQEQFSTGFALAQDAVTSAAQHMEDAFVGFATTGQFSIRSMVDGMLKDLARLLAHKAFVALVDTATGALLGAKTSTAGSSGGATVGGADLSGMFGSMLGGAAGAGGAGKLSMGSASPQAPKLYVPSKADILPPAGESGGAAPITLHIHVHQDGTVRSEVQSPGGKAESEKLARGLGAVVLKVLGEQLQPGGMLYNGIRQQR